MDIVRTQVYLRRQQHRLMRQEAHRLGLSLTELLRRALDEFLYRTKDAHTGHPKGLSALVGLGESHLSDGSLRHDDYVADAIAHRLEKKRKSRRSI